MLSWAPKFTGYFLAAVYPKILQHPSIHPSTRPFSSALADKLQRQREGLANLLDLFDTFIWKTLGRWLDNPALCHNHNRPIGCLPLEWRQLVTASSSSKDPDWSGHFLTDRQRSGWSFFKMDLWEFRQKISTVQLHYKDRYWLICGGIRHSGTMLQGALVGQPVLMDSFYRYLI